MGHPIFGLTKTLMNPSPVCPWSWSVKSSSPVVLIATRNYAARKGTRERKEKIYRANRAKKLARIRASESTPAHLRKAMLKKLSTANLESKLPDQSNRAIPVDNVWFMDMYRRPVYTVEEAVRNFQESHHPSILNLPNAYIKAWIEMDLSTKKKTLFANPKGVVLYPHLFDIKSPKRIFAFCLTPEQIDAALEAGAHTALGLEAVKLFQEGKLDDEDFDHFVAHADILANLSTIRGILGDKYPRIQRGNVGFDPAQLVKKFIKGIEYSVKQDVRSLSFGVIETAVGQVNMDPTHIKENFSTLVQELMTHRPKNSLSTMVKKAMLTCESTPETFEINVEPYLAEVDSSDSSSTKKQAAKEEKDDDDDDKQVKEINVASN